MIKQNEWSKHATEEWRLEDGMRSAEIFFKDKKFLRCDFRLEDSPYNYEDWMFLKEVANKIVEINKQYIDGSSI